MSQDCLRHITTLPWPALSPDLSPVDHIWDHLERHVGQSTNLIELDVRLQQLWNEMSQDIIRNASSVKQFLSEFLMLFISENNDSQAWVDENMVKIHSLPKVKHGEENANFRKLIRIEEDAIRRRGRWNQVESQSDLHTCDTSMVTTSFGKAISVATVHRRLHTNGTYARVPRVCIPLSVQSRGAARLKWCREHCNWTVSDWGVSK
ncbi:transposable element Tc1 transposase [Trichonephila clavipes]|nr:transposable element Tc1 transposase [Trichonephila clavipes]